MKKTKILSLVLAFIFLFAACIKQEESSQTNSNQQLNSETIQNSDDNSEPIEETENPYTDRYTLNKGILLYMGYNANNGRASKELYPSFSVDDIRTLQDAGVEEFILCPTGEYNFTKANDSSTAIIKQSDIDAITLDMVGAGSENELTTIKSQYTTIMNEINKSTHRSLDNLLNMYVAMIERMIRADENIKIYPTFPENSVHVLDNLLTQANIEILYEGLRERLSDEVWQKNICGFYFCQEAVVQWYTGFNPFNETDFDNPIIKRMRALSDKLHEDGKKFVWIPYYRSSAGEKDGERIGHIANRTNIFDYICIQPSYYFDAKHEPLIDMVANCVENKQVYDYNGQILGGEKNSETKIGPELEVDTKVAQADYSARFDAYIQAYKKYVGEVPLVFYAGHRDAAVNEITLEKIRIFYAKDVE